MIKKSRFMNTHHRMLLMILAILAAVLGACAGDGGTVTTSEEESDAELPLDESYDAVRNGVRLVLSYDAQSNSFDGWVENTTDGTLKQVRVEVHLSNDVELGPTTPADLEPGESMDIVLAATDQDFDGWTAHPEVGEGGEHGHGNGGENEHGNGGEHGGGEEGEGQTEGGSH